MHVRIVASPIAMRRPIASRWLVALSLLCAGAATTMAAPRPAAEPARGGAARPHAPNQLGRLDAVGRFGGPTEAVAPWAGRLLVGAGERVVVMAGCDPRQMEEVAATPALGGLVNHILVEGDRAWVAAGAAGLIELALATEGPPMVRRRIPIQGLAAKTYRDGNLIFVVAGAGGLSIVDLGGGEPRLVTRIPRIVTDVAASGTSLLLLARNLFIYDLANPASPIERRVIEDWADAVVLRPPFVFAAASVESGGTSRRGSLRVHALEQRSRARLVADLPVGDQAQAMVLAGDRLYFQGDRQLTIIDVADPTRPRIVTQIPTVGTVHDIAAAAPLVWLAAGSHGLQAAQIEQRAIVTGPLGLAFPRQAVLHGRQAFVEDAPPAGGPPTRVVELDLSRPDHPSVVASIPEAVDKGGLLLHQGHLYLGAPGERLAVFDVRRPGHPRPLTSLAMPPDPVSGRVAPIWRLAADGDRLYVANDEWVRVFDITDPAAIRPFSARRSTGGATDLAAADLRAYVLGPSSGTFAGRPSLQIYDFFKPQEPVTFGSLPMLGFRGGIQVRGSLVYSEGLQVVDVGNVDKPVEVGRLELGGRNRDSAWAGEALLLARGDNDGRGELVEVEVSQPTAPRAVRRISLADEARDVAVSGPLALVAAQSAGLMVVALGDAPTLPSPTPGAAAAVPTAAGLSARAYLPLTASGALAKCP